MRSHGASANHDCLERTVSMRHHCAPSLTYSRAGFQSEDRAADLRDKGRAARFLSFLNCTTPLKPARSRDTLLPAQNSVRPSSHARPSDWPLNEGLFLRGLRGPSRVGQWQARALPCSCT
ncbi:hypothetical protein DFH11DRAFT_1744789 [Phellopilus nigrolimitatus]|nr:hypothetical protein DFH11DRAFT_1744789 [Phellopilus nigrolimitatus]